MGLGPVFPMGCKAVLFDIGVSIRKSFDDSADGSHVFDVIYDVVGLFGDTLASDDDFLGFFGNFDQFN